MTCDVLYTVEESIHGGPGSVQGLYTTLDKANAALLRYVKIRYPEYASSLKEVAEHQRYDVPGSQYLLLDHTYVYVNTYLPDYDTFGIL